MTRIWQTGVHRSEVLRGSPSSVLKKRKPRAAAKIRQMKKARRARRAGEIVSTTATTKGSSTSGEERARVHREAEGDAAEAQLADEAVEHACNATQVRENSDTTARSQVTCQALADTNRTGFDTDQVTTEVTSLADEGGQVENEGAEWVCLICTYLNADTGDECASCRSQRPAIDHIAVDTEQVAADTDQVADESAHGHDLTKGTTWVVILRFLRRLRDAGRDFVHNAIAKNNFAVTGRRGARVLAEIGLVDGIYVVAAYNHSFVGHGIVLTVQGSERLIYDLDEGKPIASAEDWINFYSFIRPFIVFKKK